MKNNNSYIEPINCKKEYNEEICKECEYISSETIGHPGGSRYHSAKKYKCEFGYWEDDF